MRMKHSLFITILVAITSMFFAGNLSAQKPVPPQSSNQKQDTTSIIIIDHFGKFLEDRQGIDVIKWISQGLQLRLDSTYIYADSAVIWNEERIYAYGNVIIQQGDSIHIFTDTLYYTRQTGIANLLGEVALEQGGRQLWTKDLDYNLVGRYGIYSQGGALIDGPLQVTSKAGRYDARSEGMLFKDSVVVLHPKFNLAADSLTYDAISELVKFNGPTNIYTPSGEIYCEDGFYDLESEKAEFTKNAQYIGGDKKAKAEIIVYDASKEEVTMYNNVEVTERDRKILGDSIRYHELTGDTWIYGSPAFYTDSLRRMQSDTIYYNDQTKKVSMKGPSELVDGSVILKALSTEFDEHTGLGYATGSVHMRDTAQNFGIVAENLQFSQRDDYANAHGKSRPYFYSLIEGDTLYTAADTITMWRAVDTIVGDSFRMIKAYNDVRIYKSDLQGVADSLSFNGRDSVFTLFHNPVLWSDTTQFSADTISIFMRNKVMDKIVLIKQAIIISEIVGHYYDQIKGREIVADFDSSKIRTMLVTGNAESIYYTRDEVQAFIGVNQTSCAKMLFYFSAGQIQRVTYFGESNSSLDPMHSKDHHSLRLDGFKWITEKRPHSLSDLLKVVLKIPAQ